MDGVLQPSLDAIEAFKVLVSGNSAENGHAAGGSVKAVYKSGTNTLHGSFEERYLNGKWTHREYLTQFPVREPWRYTVRDFVGSGPVYIPKLYNGMNRTFWLADYVQNHEDSFHPNSDGRTHCFNAERQLCVPRSHRRRAADLQPLNDPAERRHTTNTTA